MDDKTFLAAYVAKEVQRINERIKKLVTGETPPLEAEKDALVKDVEATLTAMQQLLAQIPVEDEEEAPPAAQRLN